MARMLPQEPDRRDPKRRAEALLFDALRDGLTGQFTVLHGVSWLLRRPGGGCRDGEADFVVLHPQHGVLVIEVKGGGIARDGRTGRWTSTDARGEVHDIHDPYDQAAALRRDLVGKLHEAPGWGSAGLQFGHAVAFPDCEGPRLPLGANAPPELTISHGDLRRVGEAVMRAYRHWAPLTPIGEPGVDALVALLAPTFDLRLPLVAAMREEDRQFARLTEEQISVLEGLGRNRRCAVVGGAGTGKTVLAVEKARRLAREGFRTLLVCFNRPLADLLRAETSGEDRLVADTFHTTCWRLAREAGVPLGDTQGLTGAAYDDAHVEGLLAAVGRDPRLRFDAVVVDEAQDFADAWIAALELCLADPDSAVFYRFLDDRQQLYRRGGRMPDGLPVFELTRNLRNTRAIHEVLSRVAPGDALAAHEGAPPGRPVEEVVAAPGVSPAAQLAPILERLVGPEHLEPSSVAVLCGRAQAARELQALRRVGRVALTADHAARDAVLVETVHRFKGLERAVVVLTGFEPDLTTEDALRFYVGASRARNHLVLLLPPGALPALERLAARKA